MQKMLSSTSVWSWSVLLKQVRRKVFEFSLCTFSYEIVSHKQLWNHSGSLWILWSLGTKCPVKKNVKLVSFLNINSLLIWYVKSARRLLTSVCIWDWADTVSALKFVFGRIARLSVVCSALLVFYCFYQFMVNKAYY